MTETRRILGHTWLPYKTGWATQIEQRYSILVSPAGPSFVVRIAVDYAHAPGNAVGIMMPGRRTEREAMQAGIDWVDRHISAGSPDAEEVLKNCYIKWKTIFRTRLDVLDHLFCTIGNGYDWLDGSLVETTIEDQSDIEDWRTTASEGLLKNYLEALPELREQLQASFDEIRLEEKELPVGPMPDDGRPYHFYPVSEFSSLLMIPPDVMPDWLLLAYEVSVALRDRSAEKAGEEDRVARNRQAGTRIARELKDRYPQLLRE